MKKTQQEYGFDHTGIFIGKVVNTDKKFQLDFDGKLYHLRADFQSSGQRSRYKAWVQAIRWDPQPTEKIVKLLHLKEVSGQWEEKVKHANVAGRLSRAFHFCGKGMRLKANKSLSANKISDNNGHKWQGKRNDCEEYVKAFEKAL